MTCSWKLMIVNLWDAASAFCCTIIRMLWLWITLYSNWIFYGNYTQICFVLDLYIWFFSTPCHIGLYSSYVINLFCFFEELFSLEQWHIWIYVCCWDKHMLSSYFLLVVFLFSESWPAVSSHEATALLIVKISLKFVIAMSSVPLCCQNKE